MSLTERPAAPAHAFVQNDHTGASIPVEHWNEWLVPDQRAGVVWAKVALTGLAPRARHHVRFIADGQVRAEGWINTLPDRLPGMTERPFTMLLGSCFCRAEDKSGRVGRTFTSLPAAVRPELKILAGDQVYLDSPFYKFLLPHTKQGLAETFLQNYVDTWTQAGDLQGFRQVLSNGPAVFSADDHEFWNNAPFRSFSVNTFTEGGRRDWWELALGLFQAFQMPAADTTLRRLAVGELEIMVADTRVKRSADRTTLLPDADMQALVSWIQGLTFPGLLVLGQPIFAARAGFLGNIEDWNFPDFDQYATLCRALLDAPQPVIVLTGDVHYGRVARVVTPRAVEIVEIIASPMSLVTGGGQRTWKAAPDVFPSEAIPGLVRLPIETVAAWNRAADHFLTLELWQDGGRLGIRARTWETAPDGSSPTSPVYEHTLLRAV